MRNPFRRPPVSERPLLKPYAGVGASFWQRNIVLIATILLGVACIPYGFYYALFTPWLLVNFMSPLAVLVIILIWVLPPARSAPDVAIERLFFTFFIVFSLWPNYLALAFPGLPWITVTRLVGIPLVLVFLTGISTSATMRTRLAAILNESPGLWKMLALFVLIQTASIAVSTRPGESLSKYLVHQTNETAIFFVCAYVFGRPGRLERWAWMFWGFAVILSIFTLIEFRLSHVLWAGYVPSFLAVQDETVAKILSGGMRVTTDTYRAQSIFSTSLGCGEYLAYATPFVVHIAASKKYSALVRFAALGSLLLIIDAILATDSRLGILGYFIGTSLYVLVWAAQKWRREPYSLLAPTVLAIYPVGFLAFIAASFTIGRVKAKVWGMGQYENSNQARIDQFHMSIPKLLTHPWGYGVGRGGESLGYTNLAGSLTIDVYYVLVAMEYGIIGFFVFFGIFAVAIGYSLKYVAFAKTEDNELRFAFPLCISLFIFIVAKAFFAQEDNHPIVFMLAGIVSAVVYRARIAARAAQPVGYAPAQSSTRKFGRPLGIA
jgi:hypothetical protein